MTTKVLINLEILQSINDELAAHEPERLMHALGHVRPDGSVAVTHVLVDADAATSGVHVQASIRAQELIQATEVREQVVYLGVIHSHPRDVPEPSSQDGFAASDLLSRNPEMKFVIVGVVVATKTQRAGAHVMRLPDGELSVHVAGRSQHLRPAIVGRLQAGLDFFQGISQRLPQGAIDAVDRAHVVIVGAGSVGSVCAEHLVRAGVPRLTLIDPDAVEASNLSRSVYELADVESLKVDALAEHLRTINPDVEIDSVAMTVTHTSVARLSQIVASANLVMCMADDPRAMNIIDVVLHERQCPGVFAGVYRGATGGDIVTVIPGLTSCFNCAAAPRVASGDLGPGVDYSTGRIKGAVALGADVAILAALTSRVALGVLGAVRGTDQLLDPVLDKGLNFLQIGLAPGFFADVGVFAGVPAQHAFQTTWMRAEGDPSCGQCGEATATLRTQASAIRRTNARREMRRHRRGQVARQAARRRSNRVNRRIRSATPGGDR